MGDAGYFYIRNILMPSTPTAGMNFLVLGSLAYLYRSTDEDADEPVLLKYEDNHNAYRITDGRHRVFASVIAGRKTVWAKVEE